MATETREEWLQRQTAGNAPTTEAPPVDTTPLYPTPPKGLADQLSCSQRELKMREGVYQRWIEEGKISREKAEHEYLSMKSIVLTLEKMLRLQVMSEELKLVDRKADG